MRQVDAGEILDIAMAGTTATLLAKRWESALLVNVDNETLARLMANDAAMEALMRIEGFRSLNQDIETIINKSEHVKQAKKNADSLTKREKKELSEEEKEYKSKRKQIQEKLIKFATRIPVFMYLTDYREYSLQDVITKLEPGLFKKVTGLNLEDFELLVSLNVFNEALMNDAVYKFKRYEDASLSYAGINKHAGEAVGLFSTVLSREDYEMMAGQLTSSMIADKQDPNDLPDFSSVIVADVSDEDDEEEDELIEYTPVKTNPIKPIVNNVSIAKPVQTGHSSLVNRPKTESSKTKASFDLKKMVIGAKVKHKAFGEGTVLKFDNRLITVEFADSIQKKFAFPGAFQDGFLSLVE